jgi:putative transcription factor|tara:strand:+ start:164 stop:394 length:231 start_codon:yes stop_codon:yes gene_type:complete
MGITQKELAERLNEKESVITRIEVGRMVPPISLAHRLERKLEITLVAVLEEEDVGPLKSHDAPLTLGDVVKVRKRG